MSGEVHRSAPRIATLAVMAVFVILGVVFASAQSLWTDETTQLSGIQLPFDVQLNWLAGGENPIPGVPPDRMPPLSYWIGALWAAAFGIGEMPMRILGLVAMALGAPALWLSARRIAGADGWGAAAVLALVYLSPGMIVQGVEIRAYPIYFAFSLWATWAFLRALERPDTGRLAVLGLFSLAAIYTHYFGLVMAGSLWFALFVAQVVRRGRPFAVFLGGVATLVLSAGTVPFLKAALGMSGGGAQAHPGIVEVVKDTLRLGFRLLLHATHLVHPAVAGLALLGLALLGVLAVRAVLRAPRGSVLRDVPWLLVPLALAFVVLPLLKLRIAGFDVLAPHYNLWMVPLVALFLAAAFADPALRRAALAGGTAVALAHLAADVVLARYPTFYTHGPGDWVADEITVPAETVVIHDANGTWAAPYFALYYRTGGTLTQLLRSPGQPDRQLLPGQSPQPVPEGFADRFVTRILLRTQSRSSDTLNQLLGHPGDCGIPPMDAGSNAEVLSRCAYDSATMSIETP